MKLVHEENSIDFWNYLLTNGYANTYIMGNFKKFGINDRNVKFYYVSKNNKFVLMKYYDNFVFYTDSNLDYEVLKKIVEKIKKSIYSAISGNGHSINQIASFFTNINIRKTALMSYEGEIVRTNLLSYSFRLLNSIDKVKLLNLYKEIDEFRNKYLGLMGEKRVSRMLREDKIYGCFLDNQLIGSAAVTANSGISVMLTEICVDKKYRGCGIGKWIISKLISELIKNDVKFINLYADNDVAVNMYHSLGFREKEDYLVLRV